MVFADASGAEQSLLPYVHSRPVGQHGGQADSDAGKSFGHGGRGGGFPLYRHAPSEHCAIGEPHAPNAQVVPSGKTQRSPTTGAASGQTLSPRTPSGEPESRFSGEAPGSSPHATAIVAVTTKVTASTANLRLSIEGRLEL